jgi:hypothetical protein
MQGSADRCVLPSGVPEPYSTGAYTLAPDRRTPNYFRSLVDQLADLPIADNAALAHDIVEWFLRFHGFEVNREVPVPNRGDNRLGLIDLVCARGPLVIGIEIDWRYPRTKSVEKLRRLPYRRLIALRGVIPPPPPDGIDAIVSLPVVPPSAADMALRQLRAGHLPARPHLLPAALLWPRRIRTDLSSHNAASDDR